MRVRDIEKFSTISPPLTAMPDRRGRWDLKRVLGQLTRRIQSVMTIAKAGHAV
jgi:hypothetical protein